MKKKNAESSSALSPDLFRLLAEQLSEAVWILDLQGNIIWQNRAVSQMWDHGSCSSLPGGGFLASVYPADRPRVEKLYQQFLEQHSPPPPVEYRIGTDGEQWVWVRHIKLICPETGRVYFAGIGTDITARKQEEERLKSRLVFEETVASCAKILLHSRHDQKDPLPQVIEMLQQSSGVSRVYFFENRLTEDGELLMSQRYEACAAGVPAEIDNPDLQNVPYEGGFELWRELLSNRKRLQALVKDLPAAQRQLLESQQIKSILVLPVFCGEQWCGFIGFDDIARERQWLDEEVVLLVTAADVIGGWLDRQAFAGRLQQAQTAIENSSSAITMSDTGSRLVYVNQAALELWGYQSREQMESCSVKDLWAESCRDAMLQVRNRVLEIGRAEGYGDLTGVRADGSQFPVAYTAVLVRDNRGNPLGMTASWRDISGELADKQALLAAKETAEAASRAKTRFLANFSHEIRTPMNGIIGFTEMALETELNEEAEEYLHLVDDSARELLSLIDDIIDFAKLEGRELALSTVRFGLREMLIKLVRLLGMNSNSKAVMVELFIAPDVPDVIEADEKRLRQMLVNLLGNAFKFTDSGVVGLRVRYNRRLEKLILLVYDSGIGIEAAQSERVQRAFEQQDGSITRKYGGTGLGLAISKELTGLMQGTLAIKSFPGEGTCVRITLPVKGGTGAAKEPQLERRAVLVFPHKRVRRSLKVMLEHNGYRVDPFPGVAELRQQATKKTEGWFLLLYDGTLGEEQLQELFALKSGSPALQQAVSVRLLPPNRRLADPLRKDRYGELLIYPMLIDELNRLLSRRGELSAGLSGSVAKQILVAEDEEINRALYQLQLERMGHRVVLCADGKQVWEQLNSNRFDLLLLDLHMPELSGEEILQRISAKAELKLPVVVLTANVLPEEQLKCEQLGAAAYLVKPVSGKQLHETIAQVLGER